MPNNLKDFSKGDGDFDRVDIGSSFKVRGGFEKWEAQRFSQYFLTPTESKEGKMVLHFGNINENGEIAEDKSFRLSSAGQIVRFHKELMVSLGVMAGIEDKNASYFFKNMINGMEKDFKRGVKKGKEIKKKYY